VARRVRRTCAAAAELVDADFAQLRPLQFHPLELHSLELHAVQLDAVQLGSAELVDRSWVAYATSVRRNRFVGWRCASRDCGLLDPV
jgi:hypothetical protein